jgi:ligand-binding sensor domain-containing protein
LDIPPLTSDCFFFSSDNILWFSTARGLTSFDGTEIHSYYPDTSAINNYYFSGITAITEDSNNNLWIATRKIALIYFNTSSKNASRSNWGMKKANYTLNNRDYFLTRMDFCGSAPPVAVFIFITP